MTFSKVNRQLIALVAAATIATSALAATDYERVRKDINIMLGIVKSAFENAEDCRACEVTISGYYLADQGVVFLVNPETSFNYALSGDFEYNVNTFAEGMAAIPLMVEGLLAEVQIGLDNESFTIHSEGSDLSEASRTAREALREARAELRERNREMRELELEAIHASDKTQRELNRQLEALESEIASLQEEEQVHRAEITSVIEKKRSEIEAQKAELEQKQKAQFGRMETVVLNAFCDYSATMRNLPRGERVSVIIKQPDEQSNIYVFEQSKLADCDSTNDDVKGQALRYAF